MESTLSSGGGVLEVIQRLQDRHRDTEARREELSVRHDLLHSFL